MTTSRKTGTPLDTGKNREDISSMFSSVAPRYDLLNTLISFGVHHRWRRLAVRQSGASVGCAVLDLCCGTGDFMTAFAPVAGKNGIVCGIDYCSDMLNAGKEKINKTDGSNLFLIRGDAAAIPFPDNYFDVVSIGFGIRNIEVPQKCIAEIYRVLKPGGCAVILEGGWPSNPVVGAGFFLFARFVLPFLGGLLSGNSSAYKYLPQSMRLFPAREKFLDMMRESKFSSLSYTSLGLDSVFIYRSVKQS